MFELPPLTIILRYILMIEAILSIKFRKIGSKQAYKTSTKIRQGFVC